MPQTLSAREDNGREWGQQGEEYRETRQPWLGASTGLGIPTASPLLRGFQHQEQESGGNFVLSNTLK